MRKIGSQKEAEEKRKRNTLILSVLMLLVLVGGTAGYAFISNPGSENSNTPLEDNDGSSIARFVGNRWIVTVDGMDLSFANSPESVANISVDTTSTITNYKGLSLYVVSDNNAINAEIASVLGNYASRVQKACYGPCEEDLPEKDCSENLIIWRDNPQNRVYQEENCIFIEGDLRAVDAFLYKILGIQ
jgi:hypothetical protein